MAEIRVRRRRTEAPRWLPPAVAGVALVLLVFAGLPVRHAGPAARHVAAVPFHGTTWVPHGAVQHLRDDRMTVVAVAPSGAYVYAPARIASGGGGGGGGQPLTGAAPDDGLYLKVADGTYQPLHRLHRRALRPRGNPPTAAPGE